MEHLPPADWVEDRSDDARGHSLRSRGVLQARRFQIEAGIGPFLKSVEDSILKKLECGEESSTQWRDVVELIRINGPSLDAAYLDRWAPSLGIAGLLARARGEAVVP